jgi:two-component system response regulator HydG
MGTMGERREKPTASPRPRVLVVDDDSSMAEMLADALGERGFVAKTAASGAEASRWLERERFDALLTDLQMPDVDGLELLSIARRIAPSCPVIVMTAYSAVDSAIESIRRGAYHYLTKPFKVDELALFLTRALDETHVRHEAAALRRTLKQQLGVKELVGRSEAMRQVCDLILRIADADAPVLLLGETGTGKGLIARAVHMEGPRSSAAFVTVNCAALPESLLESELFGHVKGAFTGATSKRIGLFEAAEHGTLFLDEVGEMSLALQSKLLDVLERGIIRAVGSNREVAVDVRIVAATHCALRQRVASGTFREDLLYRLEVLTIDVPPLRRRSDDILALVEHFLSQSRSRHPRSIVERVGPEAMTRLLEHSWPGNVRELEHLIERLVLLARSEEISITDLPPTLSGRTAGAAMGFGDEVLPLREMQRRYVAWALDRLGGRKVHTAERLGVDIKTLGRWLQEDESGK